MPTPAALPDMTEILRLNNLGVGHMEQYNYADAENAFRDIVAKAPDWIPGRVNLAIALLNQNKAEPLAESAAILRDILKADPNNPHAHYSLAIILNQSGEREAAEHFEAVTRIDSADPHAWYYLGKCREADNPEEANACMRKAAELDPYLSSAVYGLALQLNRSGKQTEAKELFKKHQELTASKWDNKADIKYGLMGRYADVIGRETRPRSTKTGPVPLFQPVDSLRVSLAEGTRWAIAADFTGDPIAELRGRARDRFGVTSATFDYNDDGKTDVLLVGAVVRDGSVGDLLLRNDGGWQFTDVTAEAGLSEKRASLGCAVGDFNNDGRPDLFITCAGPNRLFCNTSGRFEDVSEAAGIANDPLISLGSVFVDLDQDGDLDLFVTNYTRLDHASAAFTPDMPPAVPNTVYMNVGKARAVAPNEAEESGGAPLETAFERLTEPADLLARDHSVGVAIGDFDNDRDVDLFLVQDNGPGVLILNDRLMQFHRREVWDELLPAARYNGAVAADFDKNGWPDLWVVTAEGRCRLLLNQGRADDTVRFTAGTTNVEGLAQGRLIDLDLDGWFDIAGLARGTATLAHNEAYRVVLAPNAFGSSDSEKESPALAAIISDLDGDGPADLLSLSASGPRAYRNLSDRHYWVKLRLTGKRVAGKEMRTNRDGVAARFSLHAGDLFVEADQGSQTAGLGSAYEPMLIGLGERSALDVVRVRWPDGTLQAELGRSVNELVTIGQEQRK
ncbi:MAG: VCBS repeat-containing protein, partial [Planctomycetes bacterium]|nr:VCBS repeat-containing protein [Planctomycetota bacterium]